MNPLTKKRKVVSEIIKKKEKKKPKPTNKKTPIFMPDLLESFKNQT